MALNLIPLLAPAVAKYASRQLSGSGGGAAQAAYDRNRQRIEGRLGRYDDLADSYEGDLSADRTRFRTAASDYERSLESPYATSADDAAELDRAGARGVAAGERAGAGVRASLARRGLTDSSASVGAETAIASAQAGQRASMANTLAMERIRQRDARKRQLISFLADKLARSEGGYRGALGAGGNIEQMLLGESRSELGYNRAMGAQQDADFSALAGEIGKLMAQGGRL